MLLLHCLFLLLHTLQSPQDAPETEVIRYQLGATPLQIHKIRFEGTAPLSIVHLHDNEVTARAAAQALLEASGGTLLTLRNNEQRLLSFSTGGRKYGADPNRIFTLSGRRSTLKTLSQYSYSAAVELLRFSNFFIQRIDSAETIIGVHNNTPDKYSVRSYLKGGSFYKDARETYISSRRDPDDFFITTDEALFEGLKAKDFNVVLQHNSRAADDGSLSIYYGRKRSSYINVEAEHGHGEEQLLMLTELRDLLH